MANAPLKLLLGLLVGSCTTDVSWGPGAVLDPGTEPRWVERVTLAADVWGCLSVAPGGHPVRLVTAPAWPANVSGRFDGEVVELRSGLGPSEFAVLLHELGHALGWHHSEDRGSIMYPTISADAWPTEEDLAICL